MHTFGLPEGLMQSVHGGIQACVAEVGIVVWVQCSKLDHASNMSLCPLQQACILQRPLPDTLGRLAQCRATVQPCSDAAPAWYALDKCSDQVSVQVLECHIRALLVLSSAEHCCQCADPAGQARSRV